jgi:hypothetical protein
VNDELPDIDDAPADLQPEPGGYEHRPPAEVARAHLGRYPRHYGALGLFLVAMLVVPTVGVERLADLAAVSSPADVGAPAGSAAPGVPDRAGDAAGQVADLFDVDRGTISRAVDGGTGGPSTSGASAPATGAATPPAPGEAAPAPPAPDDDGLLDAGPASITIPPPPALPLPGVPDELQPLLGVISPLTNQGCSALGLAAVVAAVAGTAAQDVPVGQVLPYLAPVYSACAAFPPASADPTICALDDAAHEAGYPKDVSGLAKTPNVIGTGIDVLYGIEAAIESYTGQAPGLVAGLAEQLGCR